MNKPKSITNEEAEKIMRKMEQSDRLLFKFAIESGLRVGDILNLTVGEIKKKMTVYETKNKKERTFKLSDKLYSELKIFTKYKRKGSILFHSPRGASKPMHRTTLHRRIKRALKTLKIDASAHSARKLYAHNVFSETHDIEKVQKALNHKYVTTTCAYLDIDLEKLVKAQLATQERSGSDDGTGENERCK